MAIRLADALRFLHYPPLDADLVKLAAQRHAMQLRVAFEEGLAHRLSLYALRNKQRQHGSPRLLLAGRADSLLKRFVHNLSFQLTASQEKVFREISTDLAQNKPMLRLLQGDVGSGKTVVAALAALQAITNGYQVALMAPTEVLATQHAMQFERWFSVMSLKNEGVETGANIGAVSYTHLTLPTIYSV